TDKTWLCDTLWRQRREEITSQCVKCVVERQLFECGQNTVLVTVNAYLSRFPDARMRAMPSNPQLQEMVADILHDFQGGVTALADMLSAVQSKLGYVPPSTVGLIAEKA